MTGVSATGASLAGAARPPAATAAPALRLAAEVLAVPSEHPPANRAQDCPWTTAGAARASTPSQLAAEVVAQMSLPEKLGIVDLQQTSANENLNSGVPRLCIPALTLQDGPGGLAAGDRGVTALPAPIALGASFDPSLASAYGSVIGAEARAQGIDVVQAPDLNLARVPESGRLFETLGEDPMLAAALGVAEVRAIQSARTMADVKHFTAYTQETDRLALDQLIPQRALAEVYDAPFQAAVRAGHAASVMCAYGEVNGAPSCADPNLFAQLYRDRAFTGFIRSDLYAVDDPLTAFLAGLDMIKPAAIVDLTNAVRLGQLPVPVIDAAATRVLTEEFAYGIVRRPPTGHTGTRVDTPAHAAVALRAAEESIVLLKDSPPAKAGTTPVLPLAPGSTIGVIGTDGAGAAAVTGKGSAAVQPPFVVTPLRALQRELGARNVSYTAALPATPATVLFAPGLAGADTSPTTSTALTTSTSTSAPAPSTTSAPPTTVTTATSTTAPAATTSSTPGGSTTSLAPGSSCACTSTSSATSGPATSTTAPTTTTTTALPAVTPAVRTATSPLAGPGWQEATTTYVAPATGSYVLTLASDGDAFLDVGGSRVLSAAGLQDNLSVTRTLQLHRGQSLQLDLTWFDLAAAPPSVTIQDERSAIAQAVDLARRVEVPVVFARDVESEGSDRQSLALPGIEDALISAVAKVNPRTVVVLNSGGPVLTPWLHQVAALLEAWYPGEEDGNALAAVLTGRVDPSGRLPVSFPVRQSAQPVRTAAQWPGIDGTVSYAPPAPTPGSATSAIDRAAGAAAQAGLDIGYRGYLAARLPMKFPFGYGLSYTTFSLGKLVVRRSATDVVASVEVTNTGSRAGRDVVEAYLSFPPAGEEPPIQLVAFASVELAPGRSATASLVVPRSRFEAYLGGRWRVVRGTYLLSIGRSATARTLSARLAAPR